MTEERIAQHARERASRGAQAWRNGAVGRSGDLWVVAGERGGAYLVDLREESCSCPDHRRHRAPCKHVFAATIARAKTAECDGCGQRFERKDLTELVEGEHDGLTHFDGDRLCGPCADSSGVGR